MAALEARGARAPIGIGRGGGSGAGGGAGGRWQRRHCSFCGPRHQRQQQLVVVAAAAAAPSAERGDPSDGGLAAALEPQWREGQQWPPPGGRAWRQQRQQQRQQQQQQQQQQHQEHLHERQREEQQDEQQPGVQMHESRLLFHEQPPGELPVLPSSLRELRGEMPRGATSWHAGVQQAWEAAGAAVHHQQPQRHGHHQQQQQQQQHDHRHGEEGGWAAPQSLRDLNMGFSASLKGLQGVDGWLELLGSGRWGPRLRHLDAVSVAGALVWLVKSPGWQRLQSGAQGEAAWLARRDVEWAMEELLDRAHDLVCTPAAGGAATAPGPAGRCLVRPAELASLVYSAPKLGRHRPQLLAAAASALSQDLYACSPPELVRLAWGLAAARVNPGDGWLLTFSKAAQAKFGSTCPGHLALLAYSLARLGYRPPDVWIAAWLEASAPVLQSFSPQNLTNAAWGLSCWRFVAPREWLDLLYDATAASMPQLQPVGISQLALSLVTLGGGEPPPRAWLQVMVGAAAPAFGRMQLLQLCNVGWALANWRHRPKAEVVAALLGAAEPLLPTATPTDLSTLLWACDKLSFVPHQRWLGAWLAAAAASLPRCEPQHLTTIALVLGRWGLVPARDFSISFWRCSKARFGSFSPYQLALLVWGLGGARRTVPNTWAAALLQSFEQQLPEAEPGDVCRLVCGLSRLSVKQHGDARPRSAAAWLAGHEDARRHLRAACEWLRPQLRELQPAWLVVLAAGLARLAAGECGVVDQSTLQDLKTVAAQLDERLAPKQRAVLLRQFARLRRSSGVGGGRKDGEGRGEQRAATGEGDRTPQMI